MVAGFLIGTVLGLDLNQFIITILKNYIPIVRSLTDLTKPIVQADYNDGKPFVPIDIIQQLSGYDNYEKYIGK